MGFERDDLPIGFWSMNSTWVTVAKSPSSLSYRPGDSATEPLSLPTDGYNTFLISVDFPEPLTPVTTVRTPSGNFTVRFFRLLALAPTTVTASFHFLLREGTAIFSRPLR